MIQFALQCENGHQFDAWFRNAAAFDDQVERRIVTCPVCDSHKVGKALMAPAVRTRTPPERVSVAANHPEQVRLREALRALRRKVEAEADYVGDRFADEARKIHFGESEDRGIYGEATRDEVSALVEDGIDIMPLPTVPEEHN